MRIFVTFITILVSGLTLGTPWATADVDYKFKDTGGREITFSETDEIFYTQKRPGPFGKIRQHYEISVRAKKHKEGLEDVTVLQIQLPNHPMEGPDTDLGIIEKIYVLDKDGLVVGYDPFVHIMEKVDVELTINGIINFVKIYVVTSKHGVWFKQYRF